MIVESADVTGSPVPRRLPIAIIPRFAYLEAFGEEYPADEATDGYITRSELHEGCHRFSGPTSLPHRYGTKVQ
jgi:hypothetical protein